MAMTKIILCAAAAALASVALAAAPASAESTTVHVGTYPSATNAAYFYLAPGDTPYSPSITANFGNTITGASVTFDDFFDFTIPQTGLGSGSLSTSFSGMTNKLTISDVLIDGTSYTAAQAATGIGGIPIVDGVMNVIEVQGYTSSADVGATYTGTATFEASAAPEPAAWLLMVGGIGFIGAMLRRRTAIAAFA